MSISAITPQSELIPASGTTQKQVKAIIENGDTIAISELPTVWVYPPMKFNNKREEKFYWRTVRDVKRTLPLSKYQRGYNSYQRHTDDVTNQTRTRQIYARIRKTHL